MENKETKAGTTKNGIFKILVPLENNLTLRVPLPWSITVAAAIVEIEKRINKMLKRTISVKKIMVNDNVLYVDDSLEDVLEETETLLSVDIEEDIEKETAVTELSLSTVSINLEPPELETKSLKVDETKIKSSSSTIPELQITVFIRTMYDGLKAVSFPPVPVVINRNANFADLKQAIAVALNVPLAIDAAAQSISALTANVTNKVLITAVIQGSKELTVEADIDDDLETLKDHIVQAATTWATYQNLSLLSPLSRTSIEFFVVGCTRFHPTTGTVARTTVGDISKVSNQSGHGSLLVQVYGTPDAFLDANTCETWEIAVVAGGEGTNLALMQSHVLRGSGVVEIDNYTISTQQRPAQSVGDLKRILMTQYLASFVNLPVSSLILTDSVTGKVLLDGSLTLRETGLTSRSVLVLSVPITTRLVSLASNDTFAVDVCTVDDDSYTCYVQSEDSILFLRSVVTAAIGVKGRVCQSLKLKNIVLADEATMDESNIVRNDQVSIIHTCKKDKIHDTELLMTTTPLCVC